LAYDEPRIKGYFRSEAIRCLLLSEEMKFLIESVLRTLDYKCQ